MERILLAEDEATGRRILAACLRRMDYEVHEAEDGKQAWEYLQNQQDYALVVTDRRMPNMDGMELVKRMHNHPKLRSIPVLMQTSAGAPEEIAEGIKAGVYYYLLKPYEETTLLGLVRSAVRERRLHVWTEARLGRQMSALNNFVRGEFRIRTPEEAQNLACLLGGIFPQPDLAVHGLYELLLNAVEHGNLRIGYEEKAKLLTELRWEEEIDRRLKLPEYADKQVIVQFARDARQLEITICDQGAGFDWRAFLDIEPSRATQASGRGIAKANHLSFDQLTYQGKGNQVQAITKLAAQPQAKRSAAR